MSVARPTSTTSLKLRSRFRCSSGVFRFTTPNCSPWKISTGSFEFLKRSDTRTGKSEFLDFLQGVKFAGLTFSPPGTTTTLRANLGPGALAGVNIQTQAAFALPIVGDAGAARC